MTLYYSLVFFLLVLEMALFMLLLVPLPYTAKRKVFSFISENPIVSKLMYWLKITFVFILILFIDSVNRVYRVQLEVLAASDQASKGAAVLGHERLEVQARKFYSQRNMYLCGFTLFLSLILNRMYVMIIDTIKLEDKVRAFESNQNFKENRSSEVAELQKKLAKKEQDLETLKKQSEGLHRSYDELSDKYAATQVEEGKKGK
ncbi:B-cell receptor-associated 31-like protein [Pochonia chlamydosporia 170]|uniref:Endoplasmic reticulum transmembrane protein n=1 Tax=Pochonia chlamydosporia 170 TaxID=1380566 RepID=A0A179FP83_METCM|nr:B-cell receptor-associated 31-like protein [Pochonia chlamydosporia 170]OAQ66883.1 B-cell receptor-associated 31-like protein [Pochonia chlamydosporia 170]